MITKLLKHEFIRTRGFIGVILASAIGLVLVGTAFTALSWPVLSPLGMVFALLAIGVLVPALQIALAIDFWRSGFSATGYLTHSIPVPGARIYWVRLLWASIVTLVGLVIMFGLAALFWPALVSFLGPFAPGLDPNPFAAFANMLTSFAEVAPPMIRVGLIVALLFMFLQMPVVLYFAASIGSESRLGRLGAGGPIIVLVIFYVASQVLSFVGLLAIPYGIGMDGTHLAVVPFDVLSAAMSNAQDDLMPLGLFPPMILLTVLCMWRTHFSWNRRVSLN